MEHMVYRDFGQIPRGVWRVIYADPAWSYENQHPKTGAGVMYTLTATEEMGALDVPGLAHPDGCALWMWATWPQIRDGNVHRLLEAWGFQWKSEMVWDKRNKRVSGMGYRARIGTEILIAAERGAVGCKHWPRDIPQLQSVASDMHSRKPDHFRRLIETIHPWPERIELFGRAVPVGWSGWGNEARIVPRQSIAFDLF